MILQTTIVKKAMKHLIAKWLHFLDSNNGRQELIDQLQDKLYEALYREIDLRRENNLLKEQLQSKR